MAFGDFRRPGTDHHGEMGTRHGRFQGMQNGCGQEQVPQLIWEDEQDARVSPQRLVDHVPGLARSSGSIQTYQQEQYAPG